MKVNDNNSKRMINIFKGTGIAIVLTIILLIIFSAILTYTSINEKSMPTVIIVITALSILMGAQIATSKIKKNGITNGILVGSIYILALYFISSTFSQNFSLNKYSIIMIVTSIIIGGFGGIVGVNMK